MNRGAGTVLGALFCVGLLGCNKPADVVSGTLAPEARVLLERAKGSVSSEWKFLFAVNDDPEVTFVHPETSLLSESWRGVWLLSSKAKPYPGNASTGFKPYRSYRIFLVIDCVARIADWNELVFYEQEFASGPVLARSTNSSAPRTNVDPDGRDEKALREVCKRKV